jgi:hypothetical protein
MEWKLKDVTYDEDAYNTDEDEESLAAVDPNTRPHEYQWHGLARRVAYADNFIKREGLHAVTGDGLPVTRADNWRLELDDAASDEANEGDASRGVDDAAALQSAAAVQHQTCSKRGRSIRARPPRSAPR